MQAGSTTTTYLHDGVGYVRCARCIRLCDDHEPHWIRRKQRHEIRDHRDRPEMVHARHLQRAQEAIQTRIREPQRAHVNGERGGHVVQEAGGSFRDHGGDLDFLTQVPAAGEMQCSAQQCSGEGFIHHI